MTIGVPGRRDPLMGWWEGLPSLGSFRGTMFSRFGSQSSWRPCSWHEFGMKETGVLKRWEWVREAEGSGRTRIDLEMGLMRWDRYDW